MVIENVPDERGRESFDQLQFFMIGRMSEADGFCAFELAPAGHAESPLSDPACRLPDFRRRSGCVPAEPYPPLKQPWRLSARLRLARGPVLYSTFARTALSTFVRPTTDQMRVVVGCVKTRRRAKFPGRAYPV